MLLGYSIPVIGLFSEGATCAGSEELVLAGSSGGGAGLGTGLGTGTGGGAGAGTWVRGCSWTTSVTGATGLGRGTGGAGLLTILGACFTVSESSAMALTESVVTVSCETCAVLSATDTESAGFVLFLNGIVRLNSLAGVVQVKHRETFEK